MTDPISSGFADSEQSGAPAPAAKPASVWEDFIDIFYAPSAVYERRALSGFFLPLVVVTLVTGTLFIVNSGVLAPIMDAEMGRSIAAMQKQNVNVPAEQIENMRKVGETFGKIFAFILIPVAIFLTGIALWLVGKIVASKATLAQALMVTAYAFFPRIIESVSTSVQGLLLDPSKMNGRYRISLGVGRFFDPDVTSPMLLAIVGRLDVFTIWVTVLLAIGLAITGRISRQSAAIAAALVWVVGALPAVLQAARQ